MLLLGVTLPALYAGGLWLRRAELLVPPASPWIWPRIVIENTFVFIVPLFWPLVLVHGLAFLAVHRRIRDPRVASCLAAAAPFAVLLAAQESIGPRANRFGEAGTGGLLLAAVMFAGYGWLAGTSPVGRWTLHRIFLLAGAVFLGVSVLWGLQSAPRLL